MTVNTTRLAAATAALWALFAMPITQNLPEAYKLINFGFWFILLMYPAWVVFGWRWISEGAAVPFKLWGGLLAAASIAMLVIYDTYDYRELILLPLLTTAVMMAIIIIFDGWKTFYRTPLEAVVRTWRKPPIWLAIVAVLLAWLVVQTFIGVLSPEANIILLVCCGAACAVHKLIKKY